MLTSVGINMHVSFVSCKLCPSSISCKLPATRHARAANIKVLVYSNVETFITFRSSTPLVLSVFDYLFLGRKLPGGRSIFSILLLILSCSGYTYYDQGFKLEAYTWLCVW
mgnify:CR=1 FL=1